MFQYIIFVAYYSKHLSVFFVQDAKIRKTKDKSARAEVKYVTYAGNHLA